MRLINVHTLELHEFLESNIPLYAILSHRWGQDEISFKDYKKKRSHDTGGYRKIVDACACVLRNAHGLRNGYTLDWIWVDTCCIDKRSSAELSEAINSMFAWYRDASLCIVYLSDVHGNDWKDPSLERQFCDSTWWRRGWTLQELLSPRNFSFCNASWEVIGHKCFSNDQGTCSPPSRAWGSHLSPLISTITRIPMNDLSDFNPNQTASSIAQRMSWAAYRTTSRIEDQAYSLLGIFDVNMPLLYGERKKAFQRLQEEIIKRSPDQSIFSWSTVWPLSRPMPMIASVPYDFAGCHNVVWTPGSSIYAKRPYTITHFGLHLDAWLQKVRRKGAWRLDSIKFPHLYVIPLDCRRRTSSHGKSSEMLDIVRILVAMYSLDEAAHDMWMSGKNDPDFLRLPWPSAEPSMDGMEDPFWRQIHIRNVGFV